MSSPGVDQEIEFTWRIENCDFMWYATFNPRLNYLDTSDFYKTLQGPLISAGNPCHSVWHLYIYTRTSSTGNHIRFNFVRLHGSFDGPFTCEVSLVGPNGEIANVPSFYCFRTRDFVIDKHFLLQKILTLRCRLTFSNPPLEYTADLTELKEKINKLYLSGELSDLTLYTREKEFFVHKFLLHVRAPRLFEDLGLFYENCEIKRVKVDNISTPVLQTLLQYIYSGELNVLPEENLPEFYEIVEKYQLEGFNDVVHLKKSATISTQLHVIRRIICCEVDVNNALSDKSIYSEHISFECTRFLVVVSLKKTVQTPLILTRIQCLSSLDEDILMSCITASGIDKNDLKYEKKQKLLFSARNNQKDHSLSLQLKYIARDLESGLHLQFHLAISNCRYFNSVGGLTPIYPGHLSIFRLGVFGYNIKSLGKDTLSYEHSGDVCFCFDYNPELKAHKAVLAAWSPVFSNMFHHEMKEKNSGEVRIPDMNYTTSLRLHEFVYSGAISKDCYEEDAKLYAAADKYQVSSLFDKCSSFLASHLTLDNACDMLVLADQHSDQNLLETVQKYIASNSHEILGSSEWLSIIDTHPRQVSKILHYITSDLRLINK